MSLNDEGESKRHIAIQGGSVTNRRFILDLL